MISSNPNYLNGRQKFESKDFEGALKDYNQAIKEEENPNLYSERAVVYFYLKQLELSIKDMDYAAELDPENPYRYSSRAYIRDAMGDTEGAIEDYEKAIELDPEDSIAHNNLGLLQEKLGYKEKSKQSFNRADTLAQVDDLLEEIRQKEGWVESHSRDADENASTSHISDHEKVSMLALLRNTFTTKSGFKEYLQFIRNGFRS